MLIVKWTRNYLHNQTRFQDRKLSLLEDWLERYYPYVHRHTMMVEYQELERDIPIYSLTFDAPINIDRFTEIVSKQSWAEHSTTESDGKNYITITNSQLKDQNPNMDPRETIMGSFQNGQNAVLIDPIIDDRGIHVSKSDDESLDALELYFKYR
jgi:hypothetical protein